MRLIKINNGKKEGPQLEDFTYRIHDRPSYVIFSHRWLSQKIHGGEVTLKEFNDSKDRLKRVAMIEGREERKNEMENLGIRTAAFDKILQAMKLASNEGATHIWIDSCCIDRDNSSELTEALNSMYRYYAEAEKCLVYLHDFVGSSKLHNGKKSPESYDFKNTEWFTRGWTLQELIAPKEVIFYNQDWKLLGKRSTSIITKAIFEATKIPEEVLRGKRKPNEYTVAQRMSWAANRKTTRDEDTSYSLFGLFDVNLVPIYGEGARKAFLRLQEAIMSSSNDMSLFAWKSKDTQDEYRGVLARSPDEFEHAERVIRKRYLGPNPEYSMTNRGLKIIPFMSKRQDGKYFLPLNCADSKQSDKIPLGIFLSKRSEDDEELYRYKPDDLPVFDRAIFKSNYKLWPKESENPIYIVRDERYSRKRKDPVSRRSNSVSSSSSDLVTVQTRDARRRRGGST